MCWKCGNILSEADCVSRTALCGVCGSDVRSCKNCAFYAPGAHYDCHETIDEQVREKERSNFCGFFRLDPTKKAEKTRDDSEESHKKAFNNLFGD